MDFVDNQLDARTGTIRARAVLENKQGQFTPGMFARIQLLGSSEYDAILIEDRAVGTDQSQSFVLVLGPENKLEYRAIQPGRIVEGMRIVRQGLKPDDVVVVSGLQRVRPGAQVKPNMTTMGAPAADATATAAAATHSN
jgi:membrane fusion protein, multidrug efflux system